MTDITNHITTLYSYDGKLYKISERKDFHIGDIFIDGRDYYAKRIDTDRDIFNMAFVAPELYLILEDI